MMASWHSILIFAAGKDKEGNGGAYVDGSA